MHPLKLLTRSGDKISAIGAIVSAMGCAMCFPAIASVGAALGMGFMKGFDEWFFVETLIPIFALIALVANLLGWFIHRQWQRTALGIIGPIMVLISLPPSPIFKLYAWSVYLTYTGMALMVIFGIWDIISPAHRRCDDCADKNGMTQ